MTTKNIITMLCFLLPLALATAPQPNTSSETPVPEYQHASPAAYEAFQDLKYGIRIHWGIYTLAHAEIPGAKGGESWMFRPLSYQQKQAYQELYKTWNPTGFNAEGWAQLFATKTRVKRRVNWTAPGGPKVEDCDLAYSVMETPFHRDIIKELCDAGHRNGLAIDLYFSHTDWYDADFRPYGSDPVFVEDTPAFHWGVDAKQNGRYTDNKEAEFLAPPPTQEEENRMMLRHRQQLTELLSNYGKIDMVCLDISLGKRVWSQLKETMALLRKLQPDVMFRNRGIGEYGDYETPERVIPTSGQTPKLPWFVIYPLARSFDYDPNPTKYKGGEWIIRSLVDSVAKGGNFMVGIGPDPDGTFHPKAIENLQTAGAWLKINGEGIYATRAREGDLWHEGDEIRYTQSKDHQTIYAFSLHWPGKTLTLKTVQPKTGSSIFLFGHEKSLAWTYSAGSGTIIQMPDELQVPARQNNFFVCGFKIQPEKGRLDEPHAAQR